MNTHEWANHLTRTANQDIRTTDAISEKLRDIEGICDSLRTTSHLSATGNRLMDDTSVALDVASRELEAILSRVNGLYENFLTAMTI